MPLSPLLKDTIAFPLCAIFYTQDNYLSIPFLHLTVLFFLHVTFQDLQWHIPGFYDKIKKSVSVRKVCVHKKLNGIRIGT